jgi:PPK2 family polyphosphate:nucleotide phosphotransferase
MVVLTPHKGSIAFMNFIQESPFAHYRVDPGTHLHLAPLDPDDTGKWNKAKAKKSVEEDRERIDTLQEKLYAEAKQSLLIVLQATDTGGKDGTIDAVFEGVNPQGCRVVSFKAPTEEELAHDFLWRVHQHTPPRGMITIFNRSHYEDVLVVRVKDLIPDVVWRERYQSINDFEKLLWLNGTKILKFFLHISKAEQKERLQARLDDSAKHWKFNKGDLTERQLWDQYQTAYEDAISFCSTPYAPWYVIPANKKWYRNTVISRIIADTLEGMNPQYPPSAPDLADIVIPD